MDKEQTKSDERFKKCFMEAVILASSEQFAWDCKGTFAPNTGKAEDDFEWVVERYRDRIELALIVIITAEDHCAGKFEELKIRF